MGESQNYQQCHKQRSLDDDCNGFKIALIHSLSEDSPIFFSSFLLPFYETKLLKGPKSLLQYIYGFTIFLPFFAPVDTPIDLVESMMIPL